MAADFDEVGFVRFPGLFTAAEAEQILAAVRKAEPRDPGPNELSVAGMQFGSNLFYRSAELQAVAADPRIVAIACELLGPDVWVRWDQAVCKRPGAGWFPWHQDNGYTQLPQMHLQVWIALTAGRYDNGGLLVAPGGHRSPAPHEWVGSQATMATPADALCLDAEPGDVVVFSSLLPHATAPNLTDADRWAYVIEYFPLDAADTSVPPPHFVVARGGRPAPGFVD